VPDNSNSQIFIDFEGNKDSPPTFLGVLERNNRGECFYQYIIEHCFAPLAPSIQHPQLRRDSLSDVLTSLGNRYSPNIPIYAWSSHEQVLIKTLVADSHLESDWSNRVTDAKQLAKRWARVKYPEHEFKKKDFRGRHTLDQYLELIDYKVPQVHGAGKTGSRLTKIREVISTGRTFDDWPPSVKSHWTKLLAHNMHDCYGMMAIVDRINADT
jgi:hypothetical protein